MKILSVVAILLALAGCASSQAPTRISGVQDDQFGKNITISGAMLYVNPLGGTSRSWLIRSWVDKSTHEVSHQLYVDISYVGDWKYFQTAADDTARTLNVSRIDSHVGNCSGGCSLSETVGIELDDATLRAKSKQGYAIKLSAHSGDALVLTVSPEQINLQLAEVDKRLKMLGAANVVEQKVATSNGKARLGVDFANIADLQPTIAMALQRANIRGVFIVAVSSGSVAERAGIKQGDILNEYDGKPISDKMELIAAVAATTLGRTVNIKVLRGEQSLPLAAKFNSVE